MTIQRESVLTRPIDYRFSNLECLEMLIYKLRCGSTFCGVYGVDHFQQSSHTQRVHGY